MLKVASLVKRFGTKVAVDDVSFTIAPGEVFSLIGPNSSGKTTIARSIAGLLALDGGSIAVDDTDTVAHPERTKSVIGYIPDEPVIWSGMTGEEFLHFVGALYGEEDPAKRARKISELLPTFALSGLEKESFDDYSRGNKQKFSILAALMHEPKLLLIDEPIVGLDPRSARIAKDEFRKFAEAGGAVLLVTHTLPVAEEISTRIGVLSKGKLVAVGTLAELRAEAGCTPEAALEEIYESLTGE